MDDKIKHKKMESTLNEIKDYGSRKEPWRFPLDESKKGRSLAVIREAAEKKQLRQYPSFLANLWNQFRFLPWKCRAAQGAVLLAAMLLAELLNRREISGSESIVVCSVFLVFAGNICLSGVARLFSWHMAELEQTLYLNLKQMVCIQMLEAGILDLVILSLLAGMTGRLNSAGTGAYLLYMLVPFLWSDVLYLHMLTAFRNGSAGYRFSAGVLCVLLSLSPALFEHAYEAVNLPWWRVSGVAGALLLAAEIYRILGKIEGGDSLCLN